MAPARRRRPASGTTASCGAPPYQSTPARRCGSKRAAVCSGSSCEGALHGQHSRFVRDSTRGLPITCCKGDTNLTKNCGQKAGKIATLTEQGIRCRITKCSSESALLAVQRLQSAGGIWRADCRWATQAHSH